MIPSITPLLVPPSRASEVAPYSLTEKDDQLNSVSDVMTLVASSFARHAKRSMPFLSRYRASLVPSLPGIMSKQEVGRAGGDPPNHAVLLSTGGDGWLGVWANSAAITVILEGALGGSALFDSAPLQPELSAAQRALVARVTQNLAQDLVSAVEEQTGSAVRGQPAGKRPIASDGMYVVCEVENLTIPATIIIAVSSELLSQAVATQTPVRSEHNPEMLKALKNVEVELVAELGRTTMSLRDAVSLAVGDVLRLDSIDDDCILVRVEGAPKYRAVPVTSRGQMAVEIRSRHDR